MCLLTQSSGPHGRDARPRLAPTGSCTDTTRLDDAIGPEPGRTSPEARGDWHIAFAALGKVEGIDLRGCTDAQLLLRRAMYERETSWAPRHVGEELRLARLQARTAWENSVLAARRAETAANPGDADRQRAMAGMWQAMHDKATQVTEMLAEAQETRRQWAALTEPTRRAAIAADLELRRRHPGLRLAALRSAEPELATVNGAETSVRSQPVWIQGTLDGTDHLADAAAEVAADTAPAEPAVQSRDLAGQLALALRPEAASQPIPERLLQIRDNARRVQEEIDKLRTIPEYEEDDDAAYLGPGWATLARRDRGAILQPPKPDLVPARAVLQRAHGRSWRTGNPKQADLLDATGVPGADDVGPVTEEVQVHDAGRSCAYRAKRGHRAVIGSPAGSDRAATGPGVERLRPQPGRAGSRWPYGPGMALGADRNLPLAGQPRRRHCRNRRTAANCSARLLRQRNWAHPVAIPVGRSCMPGWCSSGWPAS